MLEQLLDHFDENEITRRDVALATGLSLGSVRNIFCGADPLSASAKYKIMLAFPATVEILLPDVVEAEQGSSE